MNVLTDATGWPRGRMARVETVASTGWVTLQEFEPALWRGMKGAQLRTLDGRGPFLLEEVQAQTERLRFNNIRELHAGDFLVFGK